MKKTILSFEGIREKAFREYTACKTMLDGTLFILIGIILAFILAIALPGKIAAEIGHIIIVSLFAGMLLLGVIVEWLKVLPTKKKVLAIVTRLTEEEKQKIIAHQLDWLIALAKTGLQFDYGNKHFIEEEKIYTQMRQRLAI